MKGKIGGFEIGLIVLAVLIAGAGGYGYYYTGAQVEEQKQQITAKSGDLQKLTKRSFFPSAANVETLKTNNREIGETLQQLKSKLETPDPKLSRVLETDPVQFKQAVTDAVQKLISQAKTRNIVLPKDFYFSFGRFRAEVPRQEAILPLSKQLLLISDLTQILYDSGIARLEAFRRTFDEDGKSDLLLAGTGATSSDVLRGNIVQLEKYTLYPFEVEFVGSINSLRQVMNALVHSPYVVLIRSVRVDNEKPIPPNKEALLKKAAIPPPVMGEVGTTTAPAQLKAPELVLGTEMVRGRLRFDVVEWKNKANAPEKGVKK
jgi:hypothetical protein